MSKALIIIKLLEEQFKRKNAISMIVKDETTNKELSYTWEDVDKRTTALASFLVKESLNAEDKVGIFSSNCPEWHFVDFACFKTRICNVPLYPTTTIEHLIHIVNDSELKILFVGSEEQFTLAKEAISECPSLMKIIKMYDLSFIDICTAEYDIELLDEVTKRSSEATDKDLVTLIYTSGTTGLPKGVMLDNENFGTAIHSHKKRIKVTEKDRSLCFLPLSHIFERAWSYFIMFSCSENYYLKNPQNIAKTLKEAKPTLMSSVPRFFEKVYSKVQGDLENASEARLKVFKFASRVGKKIFYRKSNKEMIGPFLLIMYYISKKLVYSKFKESFGGRIRFFNCGGASLQNDVNLFFQSLSLPILYGYGLTETLATVSCYTNIPAIGSVGKAMNGVKVKISSENNEILVKGLSVTKGYYNLPKENEALFTEDGWLRTGDAGRIDEEGNIYYTERLKELMKTSNGKYIAPQNVEGTLMKDKFIDQVAIVAEGETFVSALIVPDYELLESYAKEMSISFNNKKELLNHIEIKEMFNERVKNIQETLHSFEQVKKFKLLENQFTIKANEITPTLKLKRKVILEKYKDFIDDIYNKKCNIKKKNKDENKEQGKIEKK